MFFRALLISIILHGILLCWAGSCLPNTSEWLRTDPVFDQELKIRRVTFVEIPSPPVLAAGERSGNLPPQAESKAKPEPASFQPSTPENAGAVLTALDNALAAETALILPGVSPDAEKDPVNSQAIVRSKGEGPPITSPERFTVSNLEEESGPESASAPDPENLNVSALEDTFGSQSAFAPVPASIPATVLKSEPVRNQASGTTGNREIEAIASKEQVSPVTLENDPATSPVKVFHTDPVYPRVARRRGWEGTVYLTALLDEEGVVLTVEVTKSSGYAVLDEAALEAVTQWRYTWPDRQKAAARERRITVKVSFQLTE